MLTQLPVDIQEKIYNNLHVNDRVKFLMSMPKGHKLCVKPSYDEKKLSILAKAIDQKKLIKLSKPITNFLAQYDPKDATLMKMAEVLPEIKSIPFNRAKKSIATKIKDGSFSYEDIRYLPDDFSDIKVEVFQVQSAIAQCKISTFTTLINIERVNVWVKTSLQFKVGLFNYGNRELLEYMQNEYNDRHDWDLNGHFASLIVSSPILFSSSVAWNLLLEFITFSLEQLNSVWLSLIENMYIESSIVVDSKMQENKS
jgi:hypothetical protein